jgi:hypothetical protein
MGLHGCASFHHIDELHLMRSSPALRRKSATGLICGK